MDRNYTMPMPRIPYSLAEFVGILADERFAHLSRAINGSSIFRDYNEDIEDIGNSVIFVSPTIEILLTTAKEFYVDTTLKLKPQEPRTEVLLVIMAMFKDEAYPVAYALMTHKTQSAYINVFQRMQQIVPSFMPDSIFIELEFDLYRALKFVFKDAKLHKCWLHMTFDLDKMAKSRNMHGDRCRKDLTLHKLFNMSKAIILLPPSKLEEGSAILNHMETNSWNKDIIENYLEGFKLWCSNHIDDCNNYITAKCTNADKLVFHHTLLLNMNRRDDLTIWDFVKALLSVDRIYYDKYRRMSAPFNFQRQNQDYLRVQNKITSGYLCVMQNKLTVEEFLTYFGALAYTMAENVGAWFLRPIPIVVPQHVTDIVEGNAWGQGQFENRIRAQEQRAIDFEVHNPMDYIVPDDEEAEHLIHDEIQEMRRAIETDAIPKVIVSATDLEPRKENCCCICLCKTRSHACIPCGHMCLCDDCAESSISKCPICNDELTSIKKIYF